MHTTDNAGVLGALVGHTDLGLVEGLANSKGQYHRNSMMQGEADRWLYVITKLWVGCLVLGYVV